MGDHDIIQDEDNNVSYDTEENMNNNLDLLESQNNTQNNASLTQKERFLKQKKEDRDLWERQRLINTGTIKVNYHDIDSIAREDEYNLKNEQTNHHVLFRELKPL